VAAVRCPKNPQPDKWNTIPHIMSKIKVDHSTPLLNGSHCQVWTGTLCRGYGQTNFLQRRQSVHRLMYQIYGGHIPEGFQLDHLCRNKACCNPDHLEAVTPSENVRRAPHRFRNVTHCIAGHEYTPENTRYIFKDGVKIGRQCKACSYQRTRTARLRGNTNGL